MTIQYKNAGVNLTTTDTTTVLTSPTSARFLVKQIRGWVTGLGFDCCIKPNSWASSDIADWHTK